MIFLKNIERMSSEELNKKNNLNCKIKCYYVSIAINLIFFNIFIPSYKHILLYLYLFYYNCRKRAKDVTECEKLIPSFLIVELQKKKKIFFNYFIFNFNKIILLSRPEKQTKIKRLFNQIRYQETLKYLTQDQLNQVETNTILLHLKLN
jgi:hypothetical protein